MAVPAQAAKDVCDPALALDVRIRALYEVKQAALDSLRAAKAAADEAATVAALAPAKEAAQVILRGVDTTDSVLLQHELLYNIGQFGLVETLPPLIAIVETVDRYDVVSRHEALESIGAIGDASALEFLGKVASDASAEAPIRESAELAVERTKAQQAAGGRAELLAATPSAYASVDPAPPAEGDDVPALRALLLDESQPLYARYRAMFRLRDMADEASVDALATALRADKSSCLFRHEVAFVLGQMTPEAAAPALIASLEDEAEHGMVRHESAEALGSLAAAGPSWDAITKYAAHPNPLVRDSCVVAIDMHKYWTEWNARVAAAKAAE